jgi:glycosyltransferase involved in cell wall biosynthesis
MHFLAGKMVGRGYRVTFAVPAVPEVDPFAAELQGSGVHVVRIPGFGSGIPSDWLRAFVSLRRLVRTLQPSVVHIPLPWPYQNLLSLFIARMCGVKYIVQFHLVPPPSMFFPERYLLGPLAGRLIRSADFLATVSEGNRRKLLQTFRLDPKSIKAVANGLEFDAIAACPAADVARLREKMAAAGKPILAVVARLARQKDHITLINAAPEILKAHPGTVIAIAGDGPLREKLERKVVDLGVETSFRFLGNIREIPALLHAADIFVLPTRFEGFPLTVMEAMAAGKGIVVSRVDGVEDLVEHGRTGMLVEIGDHRDLARNVVRLLTDCDLRRRMGEAAGESIRRICGTVADTWDSIYRDLETETPPVYSEMEVERHRIAGLDRQGDAVCKT